MDIPPLMADLQDLDITLVVIDFEYTTPTGRPWVPIEIAVQAVRARDGHWQPGTGHAELIRPDDLADVTDFDIGQTGITPAMLESAAPAAEVMARLDARFVDGPYVLVAHHAPAEARLLHALRDHCPRLARTELLDTVRLARDLYPDLGGGHGLDNLTRHLQIPVPPDRHRAMADVRLTTKLLRRMTDTGHWTSLRHLREIAGLTPESARPHQASLFG
ncbi:3'-5' exonuclease [Actinokineospora cianjurensis]|uniref:DNA polymerase-3 subunit epsilon n=1 Tax=Actinokineospora cianjurensis TaxID=585224 RepID=A0A421B203_9PSEU|nr:3'-5' exonuclease [Actinokineospora cianjurensis]RLK58387.1 DNA polymerase-3 subunit epsilon [Actinokineospora cianjurensis]